MNRMEPPRLATWLLRHLINGNHREVLEGDLRENFCAGRSRGWYWRQVLSAVVINACESLLRHPAVLFFAVLLSMLSPAWQLTLLRFRNHSDFTGLIWRMSWPWSTICAMTVSTAEALVFIWAPMLCFMFLRWLIDGAIDTRALLRALWSSALAYWGTIICLVSIGSLIGPHMHARPIDWRTLSIRSTVMEVGARELAMRLPYFFAALCAFWGMESHSVRSMKPAQ